MRITDLFENDLKQNLKSTDYSAIDQSMKKTPEIKEIIKEVLPLIANELELDTLPRIKLVKSVTDKKQPTFGKYENDLDFIQVAIDDRHPIDIIRTLSHEMAHYKQDLQKKLGPTSGETGSPAENQAHELAGIIMRHIDKKYPGLLKMDNVEIK